MSEDLEREFHLAMVNIYETAKREVPYNATRFIQMIAEHGGLDTARQLIHATNVSDGFTALWMADRTKLTVEALINDNKQFAPLFTAAEIRIVERRLREYGYGR